MSIFSTILVLHTLFSLHQTDRHEFRLSMVSLFMLTLGFMVEAYPRGSTRVQELSGAQDYDKANLFSRLTFYFYQPVISLAARQHMLQPSDIVNQLPEENRTQPGYERLSVYWNKRVQNYYSEVHASQKQQNQRERRDSGGKTTGLKKPSLMAAALLANWRALIPVIAMRIVIPFTEYLSPVLLGLFLDYIQGPPADSDTLKKDEDKPLIYGLAIAFSIFAVQTVVPIMYVYILRDMYLLSNEIKAALIAMIYRKALKLSPDARRQSSTGAITNHMSVDATAWEGGIDKLSIWISLPFDFTICLLWRAGVYEGLEEERLKATDERIRLTSEILSNVKIVKLYGWEMPFKRKISQARSIELGVLRRMGALEAIMSVVFASSSVIVSLITFAVYVTIGNGELTPKIVFVSIALFDQLHEPVSRLAEGTTDAIGIIVATKRIQRFLFREEIDDQQILREAHDSSGIANAIEVEDAVMSWTPAVPSERVEDDDEDDDENNSTCEDQPLLTDHSDTENSGSNTPLRPTLRHVNLTIKDRTLTAVVGRVGQGKSSLLSAIIGEMYKIQGTIRVRGRVAYVPQQAWIFNATLRDNILFGNAFNQERYRQVLQVCGLEPDLAILPAGDLTEIGERGINLSGGQKQRVSLARAAYDDADVYLLDDPLSAVDAHVDRYLWDNLIGSRGLLKDKARILVTHGVHHLEHVDQIVVMNDGEVSEVGRYEDLVAAKRSFYYLIKDYASKHVRRRKNSLAVDAALAGSYGIETAHHASESTAADGPSENVSLSERSEEDALESDSVTLDDDVGPESVLKRTASMNQTANTDTLDEEEDRLIEEEVMKKGSIEWKLVKSYAKACTLELAIGIVLINAVTQLCQIGFNFWLKHWISKSKEELQASLPLFLGVYTAMTVVYVVFYVFFVHLALAVGRIRASELIHRRLISKIIRMPMSFFDTTPLGRIVNRFSSDLYSIDENLPWKFIDLIYLSISVFSTFVVLAATTPVFILMIPPVLLVYYIIQNHYLWAIRSLKRMNSVAISPLYQHFDETLNGVSTIRAMAVQERFIHENTRRTDYSSNAFTAFMYCNRWVELRLQFLSASIILVVALSGVFSRYTIDPSLVGLALNFAISIADSIMWLCRDFSGWQSYLVAVERVQEYTDKYPEAPEVTDKAVPESWPDRGRIVFKNYSTRYREGLDLAIKHLSFEVMPGERIGIVGRTGAGKSSLTLALFRIVEAANSHWARASDNTGYHAQGQDDPAETDRLLGGRSVLAEGSNHDDPREEEIDGGSIEIDGIDIATIGLSDLRKHLAIIPQDPTLFEGTIRDNLDPFQEVPDAQLWEALERAHLKDHIRALPGGLGLNAVVAQNGENFSVGQRSLICLARALLRKSKILILDEATAAVDIETDELIQRTIRLEFRDRTILTIAHRIKTVMDSSRILVMEQGRVVEMDAPEVLLQRQDSLFFKLAHQAGEVPTQE
ncbi:hypothetical protein BGZ99_007091 [Dissophora globulifera]|uniref:P-loop containing nucleoside triphosphate hydrolase protein n=1 Tax=Dissophora globulifera TaxID=979702 RepID=A0A9P6UZT3_9FUNG|nr:hypothetical protein BGZ99_007091 [Dissophora globulifera]